MTTEERFKELEREKEWFETYFKDTWKKTKKQIRKEVLWGAFSRGGKNKDEEAEALSDVTDVCDTDPHIAEECLTDTGDTEASVSVGDATDTNA